jgi:hypothetical protein
MLGHLSTGVCLLYTKSNGSKKNVEPYSGQPLSIKFLVFYGDITQNGNDLMWPNFTPDTREILPFPAAIQLTSCTTPFREMRIMSILFFY